MAILLKWSQRPRSLIFASLMGWYQCSLHIGCTELKNWENCICLVVNLAIRLISSQITQWHPFLWKNKKNYSIFQNDVKRNRSSENIIFWRGQWKSSIHSTWCQLKLNKWHERNKNGSCSKQNFQDLRKSMTSREVLKQNNSGGEHWVLVTLGARTILSMLLNSASGALYVSRI